MKRVLCFFCVVFMGLIINAPSAFCDWNPGGIQAAPAGTKGMLTYFRHYSGNEKYKNGSKVSDNEDFEANITIFRPIMWFEKYDMLFAPQILQPVGTKRYGSTYSGGKKIDLDQTDSGIGDTTFSLGIWPHYNFDSKSFWLIQFYLTAPTGNYDHDKAVNMGSNRWQYKIESGYYKKIPETNFSFEVGGGITAFGDNTEYGSSKSTMEEDPAYSLQASVLYDFTKAHNIAFTGYYNRNGEKNVGDLQLSDSYENYSVQISFGWWTSKQSQLFLKYRTDVEVEEGLQTDIMALRWTYLF